MPKHPTKRKKTPPPFYGSPAPVLPPTDDQLGTALPPAAFHLSEDGTIQTTPGPADRVPAEALLRLESDAAVQAALRNPHVRRLLREIDSSHNPVHDLRTAMAMPVFVEFADACLAVCGVGAPE